MGNFVGDGTWIIRRSPVFIMDGVVSVSSGMGHRMAIRSDGSLWGWGSNFDEQFGLDVGFSSLVPVMVYEGLGLR